MVSEPLTGTLAGGDPETQLEFWHQLADRPMTSNDEAFHGLLLYLDGEDASADYDARVQALKTRDLLPDNFRAPADQAVTRGTLAVALSKSLQVRGGVMNRIWPDNERYALRELVYVNLYPPSSSPNQTFSGSEFLGIIGRMEDWQRSNPIEQPNYTPGTEESTAGETPNAAEAVPPEAPKN